MKSLLMVGSMLIAACGGLSYPVSNDGADAKNPAGQNPGTQTLSISVARTNLMVGDTVSINGTVGGATISNNGLLHSTSTDSSVAVALGTVIFARSVGTAQIGVDYGGYTASTPISISVSQSASGVSAYVVAPNSDPPAFVPATLTVAAGSIVRFSITPPHNVVFDPVPGAPANIALTVSGTVADRVFPTPGSFAYRCTLHGEAGVVNVTP